MMWETHIQKADLSSSRKQMRDNGLIARIGALANKKRKKTPAKIFLK